MPDYSLNPMAMDSTFAERRDSDIISQQKAEIERLRAALAMVREQVDRNAHGRTRALAEIDSSLEQTAPAELVRQFNAWDGPKR